MESLNSLEANVKLLLEQYQMLQQQLRELKLENERQRDEIMRTHAELVQIKADYNHLKTTHALLSENADAQHRDKARQRLPNIIAQIDRALEALKH
jgi:chromosome segregation ATPase